MAGNYCLLGRQRRIGNGVETDAKNALNTFWLRMALLAFPTKDLALEPCDLTAQINVVAFQLADQIDQLRRRQRGRIDRRGLGGIGFGWHLEIVFHAPAFVLIFCGVSAIFL